MSAQRPHTLVRDTLLRWSEHHHPTHVRVYQSGDDRVLLLSQPYQRHQRPVHTNPLIWFEHAAMSLRDDDPSVLDATWVMLKPAERVDSLGTEHPDTAASTSFARVNVTQNPGSSWLYGFDQTPLTREQFHRLLPGAHVDFFDWYHYTPDTVQAWLDTRQPVPVLHARDGFVELTRIHDAVHANPHLTPAMKRPALVALGVELALHQQWNEQACATPPDDPSWLSDPDAYRHVNTSIRLPYVLPEHIRKVLPQVRDSARASIEERRQNRVALLQALHQVDEFSDHPDPVAAALLVRAQSSQNAHDHLVPPHTMTPASEPHHPRSLGLLHASAWDQQYLRRITWSKHDPRFRPHPIISRRQARILAARVCAVEAHDVAFGVDAFGHPVARDTRIPQPSRLWPNKADTPITIMWPTHTHLDALPPGTRLVATGDIGDRPVYLAHQNRIIGLLPRDDHDNGWNFGYGGGGSGYLAMATAAFLATLAGLPDDAQPSIYDVLEPLIDDRSQWDHLDVDLTTITTSTPQ